MWEAPPGTAPSPDISLLAAQAVSPRPGVVSVAELATCCRCGKERPLEEFARDASKASGHKGRCKSCDNARCRDYYARNRDKVIARVIARRDSPQLATCPTCGEPFAKTNGRQRYCKPEHRPTTGDRGAKVTASCAWCGREFEARARDRARGGGRFCCKSHALQYRSRPGRADGAVA
jgi:hypothetical protein